MPHAISPHATLATLSPLTPSLKPAQLAHLERRLLEERGRTVRTLSRLGRLKANEADEHSPASRVPDHMADAGSETMQDSLDAVFASRETEALQEIDAALRRLYREPARFGLDERTGEAIPFERLDIIPWARRRASAV